MLYAVTVTEATDVNESVRILRLDFNNAETGAIASITSPSSSTSTNIHKFLPGQWLNIHLDGLEVLRGCGIISTPRATDATQDVAPEYEPHIEAIIRKTPTVQSQQSRPEASLTVGIQLKISFGGSLVWPPNSIGITPTTRLVFIAGGVGVSPLISILSHILETETIPREVHLLYASSVKGYYKVSHVLGLERLLDISKAHNGKVYLYLFFAGYPSRTLMEAAEPRQRFEPRVMMGSDILDVFRSFESQHTTVCYVAGPPGMTRHFVKVLQQKIGIDAKRVLYEEYENEVSKVHTEI